MSDNLNNRGPQDGKFINTSESWEVNYWTSELNCTKEELEEAVREVGNSAEAVRAYLKE
jgi:hypothetical protein